MSIFSRSQSNSPQFTPVRPFESYRPHQEVVGESNYIPAIQALFAHQPGGEIVVDVQVVHDPSNRFDSNAVEIRAHSGVLGFLPREDAAIYAPILRQLQTNHQILTTDARVYGRFDREWDTGKPTFIGSVSITLPAPHLLFPINVHPSAPSLLLPPGNSIQVSGEENHSDSLKPYLTPQGEAWVYATLHSITIESGRTPKTLVEVHIDGNQVGTLTKASSENLLPAVRYLEERSIAPVVRAMVRGNALKSDVTLHTSKSGDLDMKWFEEAVLKCLPPNSSAGTDSAVTHAAAQSEAVTTNDSPPPPRPPAGWYDDPQGISRLRYWDGQTWTDHRA